MVKDIQQLITNLLDFYDFKDKTIISVGAGGGQFIEYGRVAKQVIAIDNDEVALKRLQENLSRTGLTDKFTLIHSDFTDFEAKGDVVLFEFCLHEMEKPQLALAHAQAIALQMVVADHGIDSEWAFIADEREKAIKSWSSVDLQPANKSQTYRAQQYFKDYQELYQKVKVQGERSIERIENYKDKRDIIIPMSYKFVLINS
ncbi:MAG: class I SAM-dependent methyltransferase [Marinifilaceae bacterium]